MYLFKKHINFGEFMGIFSLKNNKDLDELDIRNTFQMISGEYEKDGMIKMETLKKQLHEMGMTDVEIVLLTE